MHVRALFKRAVSEQSWSPLKHCSSAAFAIAKLVNSLMASRGTSHSRVDAASGTQVPAYFDEDQKEATKTAGKIAGLQTVRLIRQCSTSQSLPSLLVDSSGNAQCH